MSRPAAYTHAFMKRGFAGIGMALALALLAAPARGEGPLEPPDLSRYLRWGPVRARPGFVLTHLGYDGNIYYNPNVQETGDYTVTLSPRLDGVVLFQRGAFLTFAEQLDWTLYKSYGKLNYLDQRSSARLTLPLEKLGFYVEGALNDFKERPADALDVRTDAREWRLGAGILFEAGWRTDAEIGFATSSFGYSDPDYKNLSAPDCPTVGCLLDRTERGTRARVRYLVFGRTRLTLEITDKNIAFSNEANGRDASQVRVLPGVEFGLGGRLAGALRLGRASLDSRNPDYPDFSGAVGDARLSYRFGAGTTVAAGGSRDVGFSIYMPTGYYVNTSYDARVIQYFNRLFGAEAGASRGRISFPAPATRDDRVVQYDGGIRLRLSESALGRKVEYSLKITRWFLTSSEPGIDQSRTVVGFGAVIGY
jgi:hypothetical protein